MNVIKTKIPGVVIIEPKVYGDSRGFFMETFQNERYAEHGLSLPFVQDNASLSQKGVLRGLHLQNPKAQGKLVSVMIGEVYDVALDVRVGSPTFGEWVGITLSAENKRQFYLPPGLAHGFVVTSNEALFVYKCTELYNPSTEMTVLWNDPALAIDWPVAKPLLSAKDQAGTPLRDIAPAKLPKYEG